MAKKIILTLVIAALAAIAGRATAPTAPAPAAQIIEHFVRPADGGTNFGEACRYILRWRYSDGLNGPKWTGRGCTYAGDAPALAGDVLRMACVADGGYFAIWPTDENGDEQAGGVCQAWVY